MSSCDEADDEQRCAQDQIRKHTAIDAFLRLQLLEGDDALIRKVHDGLGGVELLLFAHALELLAQMVDGHAVQTEVVHPRPRQQHDAQQQGGGLPHSESAVADVAVPQQHQDGHDRHPGDGFIQNGAEHIFLIHRDQLFHPRTLLL